MLKVLFNDKIIAENIDTLKVEGNHYFLLNLFTSGLLEKSDLKTTCPCKAVASYYNLNTDNEKLKDMVWCYQKPSEEAKSTKDRIVFFQKGGLKVVEE